MRLGRAAVLAAAPVWALGAGVPTALAGDLPPAVIELAERTLPDYELPNAAGHIGFGDFDADGREDVAALLRGADDWELVVFRRVEEKRYQADVIDRFPGDDRAFKRRLTPSDLRLEVTAPGAALELDGTLIDANGVDTEGNVAALALLLPAAERTALVFKWDPAHNLFGASRVRLAAAPAATTCAHDPQSGKPNPFGMRAFVTVEQQDGNTVFVYEQLPENLTSPAPATLAIRRELVFYETPIEQARALMREDPSYYQELTGDDDPAGFAPVDDSLVCR